MNTNLNIFNHKIILLISKLTNFLKFFMSMITFTDLQQHYLIIILGVYQWKFFILKEHKGNEGSCIGISKYPIKDQNYRTTNDMWLYRAYK